MKLNGIDTRMISQICNRIFQQSIEDYHIVNHVDAECRNPFAAETLHHFLYKKNWIDTVQWHLEDVIRDPLIDPTEALMIKRRIDHSNQQRTDIVECLDHWFLDHYRQVKPLPHASVNTESPGSAIDRLSILALKIYHMCNETLRKEKDEDQRRSCEMKLGILLFQRKDLSQAIDLLIQEIEAGSKIMKIYFQMKMYNDESLNPVLYNAKQRM